MKGKVKWFNAKKGYGFIRTEEGEDAFVHYSAIKMDGFKVLRENQLVEFEMIETPKGWQAVDVVPVN